MSDIININRIETLSVTKFIPRMNQFMEDQEKNTLLNVHLVHKDCKRQFTRKVPNFALMQCRIEKIDFESVPFKYPIIRSELKDCIFKRCAFKCGHLWFAFFKNTACENVNFFHCKIAHSTFEGQYLKRVYFEDCEIDSVLFKNVAFKNALFFRCKIKNLRLVDLPAADIAFSFCTFENFSTDLAKDTKNQIRFEECKGNF